MNPEKNSKTHQIRNWCLGTLVGVILISIVSNLISDSIPNPINYVVLFLSGKLDEERETAAHQRLQLYFPDGTTPLNGSVAPGIWKQGDDSSPNWLLIESVLANEGNADSGPLRFFFYLDSKFPKPDVAEKTSEKGYEYVISSGRIQTDSDGGLLPSTKFAEGLGITFGTTPKPDPGDYKFLVKIRNSEGKLLYQGEFIIRIS